MMLYPKGNIYYFLHTFHYTIYLVRDKLTYAFPQHTRTTMGMGTISLGIYIVHISIIFLKEKKKLTLFIRVQIM